MHTHLQVKQDYSLGPCIEPAGHYSLLRHVLNLAPSGTALEFGVSKGESTRLIAEYMPVIGFDSFAGLPDDWRDGFDTGMFKTHAPAIDNCDLVIGLYADTLPEADFSLIDIGLLHIDCDLYSSTVTVLEHVGKHLNRGCFVVFDEFHGFEGAEEHEQRAWRKFAADTGIGWQVVGHTFQQWGIRVA
jgi:hypothetical protein